MRLCSTLIMLFIVGCSRMSCERKQISGDEKLIVSSPKELVVGALLDAHAADSSRAQLSEKVIRLAENDVNQKLLALKKDFRIRVVIEHTHGDADSAREKIEAFNKKGIRLVIGLENSAIVFAVKDYANFHGMILLSTSSTSPTLQIDNDNLFRLVPSDVKQAKVLAARMNELTKKKIYAISRNDVYGSDLHTEISNALEQFNATMELDVIYPPEQKDFSDHVKNIRWAIDAALKERTSPSALGIYVSAYDEIAQILTAAGESANNVVRTVKWFAADGVHDSAKLLQSQPAGEFAIKVGLEATGLAIPSSAKRDFDAFALRLNAQENPNFTLFVANFYDAITMLSQTALSFGDHLNKSTVKNWRDALESNAKKMVGVTGSLEFDEFGDRKIWAYGIYSLIKTDNGTLQWKLIKVVE